MNQLGLTHGVKNPVSPKNPASNRDIVTETGFFCDSLICVHPRLSAYICGSQFQINPKADR